MPGNSPPPFSPCTPPCPQFILYTDPRASSVKHESNGTTFPPNALRFTSKVLTQLCEVWPPFTLPSLLCFISPLLFHVSAPLAFSQPPDGQGSVSVSFTPAILSAWNAYPLLFTWLNSYTSPALGLNVTFSNCPFLTPNLK